MSLPPEDADVETASADYAKRFDSPVGEWMLARQLSVTLDLLHDLKTARLLDVGGGHGQVAADLARSGRVVSVLASSPLAAAPPLQAAVRGGRVELLIGNLRDPPVKNKSFDVVMSYRLLAHAHDLETLVAGLTRSARVAVLVDYATTRSFNAVADLLFAAKKRMERNTRPFLVMRDAQIAKLFERNGFRLSQRRPQFFWPMAMHRALNTPSASRLLEAFAGGLGLRALFGSPVIARFDRV